MEAGGPGGEGVMTEAEAGVMPGREPRDVGSL